MKKARTVAIWATLGLALVLMGGYLLLPVTRVQLNLSSMAGNREHSVILSVAPGGRIGIGFEHSLYKVEQVETYFVQKSGLLLKSVYFGSFDALNYYDPIGELPRKSKGTGYEVVFRRSVPGEIKFSIARSTPIWLVVGDDPPLFLTDIPKDFTQFSLQTIRRPRIQILLGKLRS
ncbi:MAG: hypothetical protein DWQ09_09425 [Proteobacteria bacterium]|nr:MAG: hypothetical protein DWQ09_09425 [Pseudomonadota bacterium]QKK10642.1 MAG: hypothetical protein HND59_02540 [Pseudomonadota bacterium]